jgi:aldehyde:ferredoxin oxidoreductase
MIRDYFRTLVVDLATSRGKVVKVDGRNTVVGGSGLAAMLFNAYGHAKRPWDDPLQPLIFAVGPLTGYFPLMSKTVCAFKSPYHDQYAESHAGGRSALALRFADLDALVITGRAETPSCLSLGSHHLEIRPVPYLWGMDVSTTGKYLRRMFTGSGHRSILRIGPAGERGLPMACINVDTYRHFGRLGGGGAMGVKNLKGVVIQGDAAFLLPENRKYAELFQDVHSRVTRTDMMSKYHNFGTAINVAMLNELKALPCRNLQQTHEQDIGGITGERFADETLLRNAACSGCPLGCIHIGFVREKFAADNQYLYRQVSYDHEPVFAVGSMLGVDQTFKILTLIDACEKTGLDVMSAGVALAWATEAFEKGIISVKETLSPLKMGDADTFRQAIFNLGAGSNDFYQILGQGTLKAAGHYGGADFACVLGQEMAGYATGEVFFVSQALGLRHSHLDTGGYAYDQKAKDKNVENAVAFLVKDEQDRAFLTSMVACLFARSVYSDALLCECLHSVGYDKLADNIGPVSRHIQKLRWQTRVKTGFDPRTLHIPKRFSEVITWKGTIDPAFLQALREAYGVRIMELAKDDQA